MSEFKDAVKQDINIDDIVVRLRSGDSIQTYNLLYKVIGFSPKKVRLINFYLNGDEGKYPDTAYPQHVVVATKQFPHLV